MQKILINFVEIRMKWEMFCVYTAKQDRFRFETVLFLLFKVAACGDGDSASELAIPYKI